MIMKKNTHYEHEHWCCEYTDKRIDNMSGWSINQIMTADKYGRMYQYHHENCNTLAKSNASTRGLLSVETGGIQFVVVNFVSSNDISPSVDLYNSH